MDRPMTPEQQVIIGVFVDFALRHYDQRVTVEPFDRASRQGDWGMVSWDPDSGCWRVLVYARLQGVELMRTLLHELAHVIHGQSRKTTAEDLQQAREYMTGADTPGAEAHWRRQRAAYADDVSWAFEAAADSLAEAILMVIWPGCLKALSRMRGNDGTTN